MPFSLFHLGPASLVWILFRKYIDLLSIVIASVIIDIEPLLALLSMQGYQVHGLTHTFLFGNAIAIALSIILFVFRGGIDKTMDLLGFSFEASFKKIFFSAAIGANLHILLDSIIYLDIKPFYPAINNPFYKILSFDQVYILCIACFFVAAAIFFFRKTTAE